MCREDELALVRRFKNPDAACDRKSYLEYVNKVLALECTTDECAELCRRYQCNIEELAGKIATEKMVKNTKGKG